MIVLADIKGLKEPTGETSMTMDREALAKFQKLRKAVISHFRTDRLYGDEYSFEEIQTMKNYLDFVNRANIWTGFDTREERLLRKTMALIILAQKR